MNDYFHILAFIALLAPLCSFITICLVAGSHNRAISVASFAWMLPAVISAAILLVSFWNHEPLVIRIDWFTVGDLAFSADLALSNRSILMLAVVAFISFLVHIYSLAYMAGDPDWKRYFAMLGFFTFSMQGIVLSDNLLLLFVFWELVGFSSFMLIGHWTRKPEAGSAASKAFVMNRIGDAGFLIGLMIIWSTQGHFSLTQSLLSPSASEWQTWAGLCIFCGVIGKSAQFPLLTWLPAAMVGPTPVSALIHAATMVAAGVYLLIRVFHLFTEDALLVVAITGMLTTCIGALAALSQFDIKKILAWSTVSQLGLMILAIGMGVVDAAFLHLITHAFFKACLFLCAGIVIHATHEAQPPQLHADPQDIRNMGGLKRTLPVTFVAFLLSGASLAGVPFFSGFLSKEAILAAVFMHAHVISWLMIAVILGVSFLTVLYTFRMIWFVFMAAQGTARNPGIKEPSRLMRIPVIVLAGCSLWIMVSWNPFNADGWILPSGETSPFSLWLTIFSVLWVCAALVLAWRIFPRGGFRTNPLLLNAFYLDRTYEIMTTRSVAITNLSVSWIERKCIDRGIHALVYCQVILAHVAGWIDRMFIDGTVNSAARLTGFGGKITRSFQGGNIQLYIFWATFAIIIFIISNLK